MRKFLLAAIIGLLTMGLNAQEICGTDYFIEKQIAAHPELRQKLEEVWSKSDGPLVQTGQRSANNGVLVIPLVFHVFHDNGIGNISMEQIESAVDMLNEDFRRTNSDSTFTRAIFKPHAADVEVEFRLARLDPNGDCTNGVVRLNNPNASRDADDAIKSLSYWPSDEYLNIWVVNNIESGGSPGTILGYAQFPGWGSWNTYGVVIRNDRVGRTGTAGFGDRTLTHELGHCLNLLHTFQSGCGNSCHNSGDRVCDTPPSSAATYGCSQTQNTCNNDASGSSSVYGTDVLDQIENYMSYDDCQNMFSEGQKVRVQNVLATEPRLINLTSEANLIATGVKNYTEGVCKADFEVDNQLVCVGQAVQFTDLSYFNPVSYSWDLTGGFPNVSSDQNPVVVYNTPGVYPVTLTIGDSNNSMVSETKQAFITVISSMMNTTPIAQDFEGATSLMDINWRADYDNGTNFGWLLSNAGGASGTQSIKANIYNKNGKTAIESDVYDLSNLSNATLTFKYAYALRPGSSGNLLRLFVSTDCGDTWKLKYVNGNGGLSTTADRNTPYDSPAAGDFVTQNVNLDYTQISTNVRFKFEFDANGGNNMFIDDIQIIGTLKEQVQLKYPLDVQMDVERNPLFNWNAAANASEYEVRVDTSMSFNSPMLVTHVQASSGGTSSNGNDTEYRVPALASNTTYYWQVASINNGVEDTVSVTWMFTTGDTTYVTSVWENSTDKFQVNVFPNPANGFVNVTLDMNQTEQVTVEVLTLSGRLVKTVYNGGAVNGMNNLGFDATGWAAGVYMVRIQGENHMEVKKLIIE